MIKIDNEFYINSNDKCYQLNQIKKITDKNSKNNNKQVKTIYGYYTTIASAINGYIKYKTREYISQNTINTLDVDELLKTINNTEKFIKSKFGENYEKITRTLQECNSRKREEVKK